MSGSLKSIQQKKSLLPVAVLMFVVLIFLSMTPLVLYANPSGGQVTGGSALISGEGTANVTINQDSQRALLEWNQFSIAKGETVKFVQPNAQSIAANKIVGVAPSEILGSLSANGRVILMNPNGVFFAKGATIDAAGLIATTLDLDKQSFLSGGALKFTSASDLQSSVVNEGTITVSDAGLVALVAPHVKNSGLIRAQLGTAVLASGKAFAVDLYGDGLLRFAPGEGINETLVGADGQPLKAQIEQAGEIQAGSILLTASAAREVVNQSINVSGLVRATSVTKGTDGSIKLSGSGKVVTESTSQLIAEEGRVEADADTLEVAGAISSNHIQLTGDHIAVLSGASLSSNGGSILVGGDWQGSNGVRQAITTTLEAGATMDAGQGGKVVLWSDITNPYSLTTVAGNVRALGGRIETSGHLLELTGIVQPGAGGSWLIDPTNVTITSISTTGSLPGDLSYSGVTSINVTDIQTAVNAGSTVNIVATGTITQSSALAFAPASGATGGLTLDTRSGTSTSKITLAGITNTGAGTVNIKVYSAGVIATGTSTINSTNGPINLILQSFNNTNTSAASASSNIYISKAIVTRGGYVVIDGTGGTISGTTITPGSIANGSVYINAGINTMTSGTTGSGGDISIAGSNNLANSSILTNAATIYAGGNFNASVKMSGVATNGYYTSSQAATSKITADGNLTITSVNTSSALTATYGAIDISSTLTAVNGSISLTNTSDTVNGMGIRVGAALSGSSGVTLVNSSKATVAAAYGIHDSTSPNLGSITSSNGAVNITSTTTSSSLATRVINLGGAITANTGITVTATGTANTSNIATLGALTLNGSGSKLSIVAKNDTGGGLTGISTGAISLANGSNLSLISNNKISAGAISVAANTNGSASDLIFDTTTGTNASAITTGNFTFTPSGISDNINLTIKSKGSNLNPGLVGTSTSVLPGVLTIDNTNGGTVTAANAVAGIGLTLNGALYANNNIVLSGVSNGNNAIQTSTAVSTANGNIVVNALGTTATAYNGSSSAGKLTATNGSVSLTSIATTGSAINIVTGATISAKTGIILNATSTTATTVATVDVLTVTGAGSNISFTGNDTAAGSNLGVDVGAINLANGSSLSLISNNKITQSGTIACDINTSGVASSILFDATTGSNASTITLGTLIFTSGISGDINLFVKSKGSPITVSGALGTVLIRLPGTITLDNTYGATSGTPYSGFITLANAATYATTTVDGITISGAIYGGKGITIKGATALLNGDGVYSTKSIITTTGNIEVTGISASPLSTTGNGLWIEGSTALVGSANGNISFTGYVSKGTSAIYLNSGGIAAGRGSFTANGNASSTATNGLYTGTSAVITADNDVTLTGITTGTYGINQNAAVTSNGGNVIISAQGGTTGYLCSSTGGVNSNSGSVTITAQSSTGTAYSSSADVNAIAGAVTLSATSTSVTTGYGLSQTGAITAKSASLTGTLNSGTGTTGRAVNLGAITLFSGGGDLTVVGNNLNQSGIGINQSGIITDNVEGGNITFRSNNNINQTGAITMVANTSGHSSEVTYDVSTGNNLSSIVAGTLTITDIATSGPINYNLYAAGAQLNPGKITIPGTITIDNTYGYTAGVTASGYINASNLSSLATTLDGVVVDAALSGTKGVIIRGASYGTLTSTANGIRITSNITSDKGNIELTGYTFNGNAIANVSGTTSVASTFSAPLGSINITGTATGSTGYGVHFAELNTLEAKKVTVTGKANSTTTAAWISSIKILAGNILQGEGDLLVVGNNSGSGYGIYQSSQYSSTIKNSITNNTAGGSITFKSDSKISQNSALSMVANASSNAAALTYDVTTGDSASSIVGGSFTIGTGLNQSPINYNLLASGAAIDLGTLPDIPGIITLDNTYGGTSGPGGTPTSGYITSANIEKATTSTGITINAAITGNGIVVKGVSNSISNSTSYRAIYASTALTATEGDVLISGINGKSYAIYSTAGGDIKANAGNVTITGQSNSGSAVYYTGDITANAGNITITGNSASAGSLWGVLATGAISARNITVTATNNTTDTVAAAGGAVSLGALTIVAGGGDISVTGNNSNQLSGGIYQSTAAIKNNASGGSILFKSNNNISQNGAITLAKNDSGHNSFVTYDLSTGNKLSTLIAGTLTVTTGSAWDINYNVYASGANLNPGIISVSGVITLDNTYGGTAGFGNTPTTGYITLANSSTFATTSNGITVNQALTGDNGIVIKGVSSTGSAVNASAALKSSKGDVSITGESASADTIWGIYASSIEAKNITVTGTNNTTDIKVATGGAVSLGALTIVAGGGDILVTGNNNNHYSNGITLTGVITDNASGGNIWFRSNNNINQTGTITMVANTSGHSSEVNYDVSTGNSLSSIVAGALTISDVTTSAPINFNEYAAGAKLSTGAAINVPGIITLDNTWGGEGDAPRRSGYINESSLATTYVSFSTSTQATTIATTSTGITVNQILNGDGGVVLRGVSFGADAVSVSKSVTSNFGTIDITGTTTIGYGVNLTGALTAKGIALTGTRTQSSDKYSVRQVGALTINALTSNEVTAGVLGNVVITGNAYDQTGYGVYSSGKIENKANGGSVTFRSDKNIYQITGVVTMAANTSGHSSALTYDVSSGDYTSFITNTTPTIISGSTSRIDYNMYASGAVLNAGTLPTIPGVITLDNTFGTATVGGTPLSGYLTTGNIYFATTSPAIVVDSDKPLSGQYGVVLRGATSGVSLIDSKAISINGNITSTLGSIVLDGVARDGYGVYQVSSNSPWLGVPELQGQSITVIGKNLGTTSTVPVSIGKLTLTADSGNLSITGNKTTAGGAAGIVQNGVISLTSGSNMLFASNNTITQSGAITVAANKSGTTAEIIYDTTSGNKFSVITPGAISFTAGSTRNINYKNLSSGAQINVTNDLNVPGSIWLDNSWLNGASGGITAANASTYGTSLSGLQVSKNLTATNGITLKGVTGSSSADYSGVSVTAGNFTTSGTFSTGQNAINITGVSPGVASNQSAISLTGTVAIVNNSTNGNTSLTALGGRYYDPVTITNAATAGAIAISAIGDTAAVVTTTATTVTQNSNAGVFILSSNGGNVTPPKIINNGTGPVAIAAGAYLPVGVSTGGQIVGLSGNSITSPNGNVLLYSGQPTSTSNSTTQTSQNTLAYLDSKLGTLDFNNTIFSQAYAVGNVPATSPITTATGLNTSEILNALGTNNTKTGSSIGPAIQFRYVPQATLVLSGNVSKVYGTNDPSTAYDSVAISGSLENLLNEKLIRNTADNPVYANIGGTEYFKVDVNGVQFRLPLVDLINSITGTRSQYGTLAGEQVTSSPYEYTLTTRRGLQIGASISSVSPGKSSNLGLEIKATPLTVTLPSLTKTYGETLSPVGSSAQVSGVIQGVTVDGVTINDVLGSFTMTSAGFGPKASVGTYSITPGTLNFSTGSPSNYSASVNGSPSVTINPASLIVSAKNATKFKGSSDPLGFNGVDYTGFVNGETSTDLGDTKDIKINRSNSSVNTVGLYSKVLTASGPTTLGNYSITYVPGDFEIQPLASNVLAVTANIYATYGTDGSVSPLVSVSYTDINDTLHTLTYTSASGTSTNGTYVYNDGVNGSVTFSLVPSGTLLSTAGKLRVGTYTLVNGSVLSTIPSLTNPQVSVAGNLTITPLSASITATAASLVYDSTERTQPAATISGFLPGDSLTISGTQATGTHVGTYVSAINVTSSNTNNDFQNYNVTRTNANLDITPAALTLSGAGKVTKIYDAKTDAKLAFGAATLSGVFANDTVRFDAKALTALYPNKNVGTHTLIVSGGDSALTGNSAGDYKLTGLDAINGTITQAPLSVIGVGNTTKVYNRTTAVTLNASGAAVTGLITGDTVVFSPAALTAVFADKNVGTSKALTVTASASALTGTDAGNYTFDNLASFTGSITPAPLTLTGVGTATKVYDGTVHAPLGLGSSSVTGVLSGDSVSFSSTGLSAAFTNKNVGIMKAITLTAGATTLTGNDAGNYEITNLGAFTGTITRAAATLTGSGSVTKVYDRTTSATIGLSDYTFTGIVSGDNVSLDSSKVTATFPNKNVGTNKSLNVTADNSALSGTDAGNYNLTVGTGFVGSITPAPLTLTGFSSVTKVYDATVSAPLNTSSVVLTGVILGDTVSANTSAVTATFDDKNVGSGKSLIVSNAAIILAGTDAANYSLQTVTGLTGTITPAQLTISGLFVPASKIYDGTTAATVTGTPTLVGLLGFDSVNLTGSVVGNYNTKNVDTANKVEFTGLSVSGTDVGNYNIITSYSLPATITPAALTMTGLTVPASKVYDGNTSAVVSGSGALVGVFGSDDVTLVGTPVGTYNNKNVASASEIAFSGLTLGGTDATNYTFTIQSPVTASITPKTLTLSGLNTPFTKVYDGTTYAIISGTSALAGVVDLDDVKISGTIVGTFNSADVATASKVTFAGALLSGSASPNYILKQQDPVDATITPAPLTVTANADARFIGQTDTVGYNGVSYTGFVAGQDASTAGLTGKLSISRSNASTNSAGLYPGVLIPSGLSADNYTINNVAGNYDIVPAGQVLVKIANTSNVYSSAANYEITSVQYLTRDGNILSTLTLESKNGSTYKYNDNFEGGLTFTLGVNGTNTPAGFLSVGNYPIAGSNITKVGSNYSGTPTIIGVQTVTPKALTTTASKVYDGTTVYTSAQVGLNVVHAGDTVNVAGSAELENGSIGTNKVYDLTGLKLSGSEAANYFINTSAKANNGVVSIRTLTVTLLSDSKIYDGLAYTGGKGATFSGFVNNDDASTLGGSLIYSGSSQNAINAGIYEILGSGLISSNYAITYIPSTLTVKKAALTIVAADASRTYGAANPTFTTTLTGFVNGETLATSGVTGSGTATSIASANSNVGNYAIVPSAAGYSSNNYEFTGVTNGRLTVTPATLTFTANNATRQYGSANPVFTGTVTGFVNSQNVASATTGTLVFSTPATPTSNVGNYDILGSGLTANNGNYVFVQAAGNKTALSITPAPLTITAVSDSKTYDGVSYSGGNGVTYSGFRNDDSSTDLVGTLTYTGTSQGATNAGSYVLTPSGLSSSNYTLGFTNGVLTINKATLTLLAMDARRGYGLANPQLTANLFGFVNGENATTAGVTGVAGLTTVATSSSNVGRYAITPTAGTLATANYIITNTIDGTLTITPATLTITANAATREYGLANPNLTGTVTGFVNGQNLASASTGSLAFSTPATPTSNVGSYDVTGYGITANNGNYVFVQAAGNRTALSITPAPLTITAVSDSKTYDGLSYARGNGVTYSGFRNNDSSTGLTGTLSFTGTSQGAINAGSYVLTPSGLSNSNYTINYANGTLTVNPALLTATLTSSDRVYDGHTSANGSITLSGLVGSETLGVSANYNFNNKNVNTADTVTATAITLSNGTGVVTNYQLASNQTTATAHITPLYVTLAGLKASDKNYDGDITAKATGTLVGVIAGDSVQLSSLTSSFTDAQIGRNKTVTITNAELTGIDALNYRLTPGLTTTASINSSSILENFFFGPFKMPGTDGFKTLDMLDIQYSLPTALVFESMGADRPAVPKLIKAGRVGTYLALGYYSTVEQQTDKSTFCHVYPVVNIGKAYLIGVPNLDDFKATDGEPVDNLTAK